MFVNFKILQIKNTAKCNYAFSPWKVAEDYFSLLDYNIVHKDLGYFPSRNADEVCEEIFKKFNNKVEGFKGHSLSVSDIIMLDNEYNTFHYVDQFGFKTIKINYTVI